MRRPIHAASPPFTATGAATWLPRLASLVPLAVAALLSAGAAGAATQPAAAAAASGSASASAASALADDPSTGAAWVSAYAAYGEPKYRPGFTHFDYVNPDAPKGGTLYLAQPDRRSSFDKLNYFTLRGNAPVGVIIFMFEPLAVLGSDEPLTMYGLLAESMRIAPDKSTIAFRLNPKATFWNGDPVTAADVKYSFEAMSGPRAAPDWQNIFSGAERAEVIDARTIRFHMKEHTGAAVIKLATYLRVFSPKWGAGPDGKPRPFDEIGSEVPITSGPYTIAATDSGRRIEFKRNPDYWGRDLPVQRGLYNFDRVVYRYFKDQAVQYEGFKAGEFDIIQVYGARTWNRQFRGPKWDDGRIVGKLLPHGLGQGLQSYQFNLRRPKFQDIRVREALGLAWDFETINRYKMFERAHSVFNNSDFAATGLPSPGELKLLQPHARELPPQVFGPAYVPPRTDSGPNALRENLLKARALLEAAGWRLAPDGKLRNAQGEAFELELLLTSDGGGDPTWARNLAKLGITLKDRQVDFALYLRRLTAFDFDVATIVEPSFTLPSPPDYVGLYGSKAADVNGSDNTRGVKSAAVDDILQAMTSATTAEELRDACRAFDRVVMWSHWQVPQLYGTAFPTAWWSRFGMPAQRPRYLNIDSVFLLNQAIAWPLAAWWAEDAKPR